MTVKLKMLPNCITVMRILGTLALLFTKPLTCWFYVIYVITGATDVLDGFIARRFNITSEFGAKLDSVADLLFYSVMLIFLIPVLWDRLNKSIWFAVLIALVFRLTAYILSAVKYKEFVSSHTVLNKITGLCVFAIPFILLTPYVSEICWIVTFIGIISSFSEMLRYI